MISTFNDLVNKTIELEDKINKINRSVINSKNDNYFSLFNNNCINSNVITRKTISIAKFDNTNKQMFYQLTLNFSISSKQEIELYLISNNSRIGHIVQVFEVGNNSVSISGIYQDYVSEKIEVKILVNPKEDKLVVVNSSNLTVWGSTTINADVEFNAIETNDEYLLTYLENERLYYKNFSKNNIDTQDDADFEFILPAKSHSICYDEIDDICYLFRVDKNHNLFLSKLGEFKETFIADSVSKCSLICFNNSIVFSFIKNKKCYIGEIQNNSIISCEPISKIHGEHDNCYLYFNNYNGKIYFILTKNDGSNYLFESINESISKGENLKVKLNLEISTYEASK